MDTRRLIPVLALAVLAGCTSAVTSTLPGTTFTPTPTSAPPSSPAPLATVHDPGQVTGTITGPCHVRGVPPDVLPDPRCTPGSVDPAVDQEHIHATICMTGWTAEVRPPEAQTEAFKFNVAYPAYGIPAGTATELDHLVPLELGGSNSASNLWPEAPPTPNPKDKVEDTLNHAVCSGKVTLAAAQDAIAQNWMTAEQVLGLAVTGGSMAGRDAR
jgi:hypothetical protein